MYAHQGWEALATRLLRTSTGWGVSFTSPLGEQTEFSSITNLGMIERQPPLRAYVLAQALRTAGVQSFKKTGHYPALFQTQLAPALVRFSSGNEQALKIAAACGGPLVEKYLLRQPWNKPPDMRDFHNVSYVSGGIHVNKWLTLLAGMDNDIGRRFRATHRQEVLGLAQQLTQTTFPPSAQLNEFAFLFLDPQLALEFWPTYSAGVRAKGFEPLRDQWKYLVKMGAAATPEMYLETMRQSFAQPNWRRYASIGPWSLEELKPLPPKRQAEILKAILDYVESQIAERIKLNGKRDSQANEMQNLIFFIEEAQRGLRSQLATPAAGPQQPPTR
jgi:hypothetical protein